MIQTTNPRFVTMEEEIFSPVLTMYVYEDDQADETIRTLDETSPYTLTGSIFARNRYVVNRLTEALANTAGNFYINDKCTGAMVGHQPFGGARASGTNDKAGSFLNLIRWTSPRTIKECFAPPGNSPILSWERNDDWTCSGRASRKPLSSCGPWIQRCWASPPSP